MKSGFRTWAGLKDEPLDGEPSRLRLVEASCTPCMYADRNDFLWLLAVLFVGRDVDAVEAADECGVCA